MKTLIRYFKSAALIILALILTYLVVAVVLSIIGTQPEEIPCTEKRRIFINSNGVHADLILQVSALDSEFTNAIPHIRSTEFTAFGWGDMEFYTATPDWSDLKVDVALKALFTKSESAVHVTRYNEIDEHWTHIELCDEQLANIKDYIERSFKKGSNGEITSLQVEGYSANDSFYPAEGSYTLFYTSNNWVNSALKAGDIKTSVWSPFEFGLMYHVRNNRSD